MAQKKQKKRSEDLSDDWVPPKVIQDKLRLSRDKLQSLREQGIFCNGEHWLDINPYSVPRYRYHLERCKTRLAALRQEIQPFKSQN